MKASRLRWIIRSVSVLCTLSAFGLAVAAGLQIWPVLIIAMGTPIALVLLGDDRRLALAVAGAYVPTFFFVMVRSIPLSDLTRWVPTLALIGAGLGLFLAVRPVSEIGGHRGALRWMIVMFLMGLLVAFFSGGKGGANTWLDTFTSWGLTVEQAERVIQAIRKALHFLTYGMIGLSATQWARAEGWARAYVLGLVWAFLHASFDETRQTFYLNRQGSAWDVLLDMAGAATLIGLAARAQSAGRSGKTQSGS